MEIDQNLYDLLVQRLDEIKETNEKQWELIRKQQEYWTITFFIGKVITGIAVVTLAIWTAVLNLWHR